MLAIHAVSKGDAFWTYSGGLAGIIAASAGNDLYHPLQAFLIGAIVPVISYMLHFFVERRFKLDSAVGAVAVHGYTGFLSVVVAGFVLSGYPSSPTEGFAAITPWGNFIGAVIMFGVLGLFPGFVAAKVLDTFAILRIPRAIELAGLNVSVEIQREAEAEEVARSTRDAAQDLLAAR